MDRTITGVFPNQELAQVAAAKLVEAGFRPEQVQVVDRNTRGRHEFIGRRTQDTKRGSILGVLFGVCLGVLTGLLLADILGVGQASLLGALVIAIGGGLSGYWIGIVTTSQVREELEHEVDAGTVLVSVTADPERSADVLQIFNQEEGTALIASPATFTASVLHSVPSPPHGDEVTEAAGSPARPQPRPAQS